MNIFTIDKDPKISAQSLCDQHVIKMIIESSQLLSNAFTQEQLATPDCPRTARGTIRRVAWPHHPSSKWAIASYDNFIWLLEHTKEMIQEKYARYGSKKHFTEDYIQWIDQNKNLVKLPQKGLTEFAIAISPEMISRKHPDFETMPVVDKYRTYYVNDKTFATWKRNKPTWMTDPYYTVN